jgi:hypothetical protein
VHAVSQETVHSLEHVTHNPCGDRPDVLLMGDNRHDRRPGYPLCLWYSTAGALVGALSFGYQVGVLNTALPYVCDELKYKDEAVLSSAVVLGAAVGAVASGKAADILGPRVAQMVNSIPFLLGALLSAWSPNRHVGFLAGRLISGFGKLGRSSRSLPEATVPPFLDQDSRVAVASILLPCRCGSSVVVHAAVHRGNSPNSCARNSREPESGGVLI